VYYLKQAAPLKEEKLIRFLNNETSQTETREVLDWLGQPGSENALEEMISSTWIENSLPATGEEALYKKMLERIHEATVSKKKDLNINEKWLKWTRMAASYLLLLLSSYFLFELANSNEHHKPQEQKASYERSTPAGEKMKIQLPDQTIVMLNSRSTVRFDADFSRTHRVVELQGEAFFEIKPNKALPFVVKTGEVYTTAVGTAFNARSKEGKINISLTEGKVNVSHDQDELTLIPGQAAIFDPLKGSDLELGTFDPLVVTAWKEGKIFFKSKVLGDILQDLEDWYGVAFHIDEEVDLRRKITGIIDNNDLEDIMTGLSFSLDLEYNINGNLVTVQPLKPMK